MGPMIPVSKVWVPFAFNAVAECMEAVFLLRSIDVYWFIDVMCDASRILSGVSLELETKKTVLLRLSLRSVTSLL